MENLVHKPFKRIYSAFYPATSMRPLTNWSDDVKTTTHPNQMDKDGEQLLVLHGGEDISASIYGEKRLGHYGINNQPSTRDNIEMALAKRAIQLNIPILGICRGAQLMCALAGGKLVQDVRHHQSDHRVITYEGEEMLTNSVHHQMMYPWYIDYELLAWSEGVSGTYLDGSGKQIDFPDHAYDISEHCINEPELVWLPKVNAMCIQGHPEWAQDAPHFKRYMKFFEKELFSRVLAHEVI